MNLQINLTIELFLIFVIATVTARASDVGVINSTKDAQDPMETEGMFQGDIAVDPVPRFRMKQTEKLWKNGIVHFNIHRDMGKFFKLKIR